MAFENLHSDTNFNFQLNRTLSHGEQACRRSEILEIAKHVHDFDSWYKQCIKFAVKAENEHRYLHSMYYYRMAEFFILDKDPLKNKMYKNMSNMFSKAFPSNEVKCIPYKGGYLPYIEIEAEESKGTLLIHGGYDSFIEELYLTCIKFVEVGYTIILFEGEGQGATLRDGLRFNHKWEESVACILDHLDIKACGLIGISWGGYLALRAAAKDKRIKRVVAYDVLYDGLDVQFSILNKKAKLVMKTLYTMKCSVIINRLIRGAMNKSHLSRWAIEHGMYITGTLSPYSFYKSIEKHTLKNITKEIDQDVLLLAGEMDHYIPVQHFEILNRELIHANVTSRLFTKEENGEQHCQVGNYELAIDTIIDWLNKGV